MNPDTQRLLDRIRTACSRCEKIAVMEVCGTHTVSLFRSGVKSLLPENLKLVSGPGCPVCVTSQGYIDAALELAMRPGVTISTYGDMLRVPGKNGSLEQLRASGAKVVVTYSLRDAVQYAQDHPGEEVVFLAVGFETTTPATAASVLEAREKQLVNFSLLVDHKLVIPALDAVLSAGDVPLDGFMLPGHVSVVIGSDVYRPIVEKYSKASVVTGFEPEQMLKGLAALTEMIAQGRKELETVYSVAVRPEGNPVAWNLVHQVLEQTDTVWRGMGVIPMSGMRLKKEFVKYDALAKFGVSFGEDYDPPGCRCGDVIQGKAEPRDCPLFGRACTPSKPVGPCMVSSEGTCAAWYKYS